ncbi:MAG: 2-hydroxyacyl-CoA dehydratase family protein [Desulfobacteraceae bacterium]|nr:2-hydroxyacyl-CoA dehydratase family protein [Desulfobacteraceae bacterium]
MKQDLFKKIQQITEQNLMDIEAHKEKGNHVIGFYCLYGPTELAVAADAIPLPLCGTRQDPIDAAEEVLPRNLCPLIKSSYGFAATDTCPFFRFSDMIVADTTCDGKKKMFEILSDTKAKPSPLTGMELVEILFKTGFFADKEKGIALMEEICDVCAQLIEKKQSPYTQTTPRILLTGVPIGLGSDKVVKILEQCGANVVALENCSGYKQTFQVDDTIDPVTALAEQYLTIPCSVMSPNPGRTEMLREMIPEFSIDGVVDLTWQACHTYNIESFHVAKLVQDDFGLPFLHIETDYSESDSEQLRVRIQAFIEMM